MFGVCMCLFYVVLCLGSDHATGSSLVQGVLPSVKMIMKLKEEARDHEGCRARVSVLGESINYVEC
jgi:hypothetical protein